MPFHIALCLTAALAQSPSTRDAPLSEQWHLTARPWAPMNTPRNAYLDAVERVARVVATWQDDSGAVIDPVLQREHQYSTPYFAFAVGALVHAGREELLDAGVRAMEHATASFAGGNAAIPDQHGEFYIAPLTEALAPYEGAVPEDTHARWRERMRTPLTRIIAGAGEKTNNWRTYAMKGEWLRVRAGLVDREAAISFIEDAWHNRTQRVRILPTRWHMYQDWNGHPQSLAVEAVGRGNLLALALSGYDGPSAEEIYGHARAGTAATLLLQDPTGQCPPNGRTDNHVFNDLLYQLQFEAMAEGVAAHGETALAGQYRRAAMLAFDSIGRWVRTDAPWTGIYSVTKNLFDPERRVGYQPASQLGNYTGAVMYHLAEAYLTCRTDIAERPAPAEIGGFVIETDPAFGAAVVNAGGMHVQFNLAGDSVPKYDAWWTPLGVVRFSRTGWDSRLGPSDGARDYETGHAATFAPTWKRGEQWVRLADMAEHYRGTFMTQFVHPLLIKCSVLYAPVTGVGGPSFYHDFTITPDGVVTELRTVNPDTEFGLTLPVLENDGRPLNFALSERVVSTKYPHATDEQHFLVLDGSDPTPSETPVLSSYGHLRPVRVAAAAGVVRVFIYPRSANDPPASFVLENFQQTETGFVSPLGRIDGNMYVGRTSAGGEGDRIDLDNDGSPELVFSGACRFVLQLREGLIVAIETDRAVEATVGEHRIALRSYEPAQLLSRP